MATENKSVWDNPKSFRQQVSLAAVQVAALAEGELATALAYELEPFSKIPATEAEIAWKESAESNATIKVYEVAVVRRRGGRKSETSLGPMLNVIVAVAAAIALVAIGVDFAALKTREGRLRSAIAEQAPLDAEIKHLEAKARSLRDEARKIRATRESEEAAQARVDALRTALPDALDAIAAICGGKTVVREFSSPSPFEIEMRAVTANAESAVATIASLDSALTAKEWRVEPGTIEASPTGTTVEFACGIQHAAAENGEVR